LVRRGDICWLELAEEGRRPVCVLTRDEAIPTLRNVVVALVTQTVRGIPTEVRLTASDGVSDECAISFDNLRSVPRVLLTERITTLGSDRLREVCAAVAAAVDC
jgi:mRNA interferase MazF